MPTLLNPLQRTLGTVYAAGVYARIDTTQKGHGVHPAELEYGTLWE